MKNLLIIFPLCLVLLACEECEIPPTITNKFSQGTILADRAVTEGDVTTTDIYAISPDGTATKLTDSPKGTYSSRGIKAHSAELTTFYSDRDGTQDIYTMRTDGSNLQRITDDATRDFNPSLSPDGQRIAWVSFRESEKGDIWIINTDGTDAKALAADPASDRTPFFTNDGQRIAFHSYRDQENAQIFTMDPDGSNLKQLTDGDNPFFAYNAQWSPDGDEILFFSERDGTVDLYRMQADGTDQELVRADNGHSYAVYAPNGQQMAYNGDRPEDGQYRQIYTSLLNEEAAPQKVKPLSADESDYYGLSWWY